MSLCRRQGRACSRLAASLPVQPGAFEHQIRPTGQVHAVVAPLDALGAAGRDDLHVARRRRRAPRQPRRTRTSRCPTTWSDRHRAPRSRCEHDRATRRARTPRWCRPGTSRCVDSAGPESIETVGIGQRSEHDALRVPHSQRGRAHRLTQHGNGDFADLRRRLPARRESCSAAPPSTAARASSCPAPVSTVITAPDRQLLRPGDVVPPDTASRCPTIRTDCRPR